MKKETEITRQTTFSGATSSGAKPATLKKSLRQAKQEKTGKQTKKTNMMTESTCSSGITCQDKVLAYPLPLFAPQEITPTLKNTSLLAQRKHSPFSMFSPRRLLWHVATPLRTHR